MNRTIDDFTAEQSKDHDQDACACDEMEHSDLPCFECYSDGDDQDIMTDGGVELHDGAEVLDDGEDTWRGPIPERSIYGELTGDRYFECRDCKIQVHEDNPRDNVMHRSGCSHGNDTNTQIWRGQ